MIKRNTAGSFLKDVLRSRGGNITYIILHILFTVPLFIFGIFVELYHVTGADLHSPGN